MTALRIVLAFETDDAEDAEDEPVHRWHLEEYAEDLNLEVASETNFGYQGWRVEEGS